MSAGLMSTWPISFEPGISMVFHLQTPASAAAGAGSARLPGAIRLMTSMRAARTKKKDRYLVCMLTPEDGGYSTIVSYAGAAIPLNYMSS